MDSLAGGERAGSGTLLGSLQQVPGWLVGAAVALVLVAFLGGLLLASGPSSPQADSPTGPGPTSRPATETGTSTAHPFPSVLSATVAPGTPTAPSSTGEAELLRYSITLEGRTVQLPIDANFAARQMPPPDLGQSVEQFTREGNLAIEILETPWRGETRRQPELALESGDWVLGSEAGMIQVVTNFGMWTHVPNGPKDAAQFPTHIGELVREIDGYDLVYYMDAQLLGGAFQLESVPNLFVSHTSATRSLRIIRVGTIKVRFGSEGSGVTGEVDLIGWAPTGAVVVPTPDELAFYRYRATFTGRARP